MNIPHWKEQQRGAKLNALAIREQQRAYKRNALAEINRRQHWIDARDTALGCIISLSIVGSMVAASVLTIWNWAEISGFISDLKAVW